MNESEWPKLPLRAVKLTGQSGFDPTAFTEWDDRTNHGDIADLLGPAPPPTPCV
jgi:hypothetical protein